jgi:hypothetical protein
MVLPAPVIVDFMVIQGHKGRQVFEQPVEIRVGPAMTVDITIVIQSESDCLAAVMGGLEAVQVVIVRVDLVAQHEDEAKFFGGIGVQPAPAVLQVPKDEAAAFLCGAKTGAEGEAEIPQFAWSGKSGEAGIARLNGGLGFVQAQIVIVGGFR